MSIFTNSLRSQARLGLRAVARTAAAPVASRTLSSLVATSRHAAVLPALSTLVASRTFSRSAVAFYEGTRNPPNNALFVGNLPWSATREELLELFGEFGEVAAVRIQTHADGRPRGFGHVDFVNKEHAIACVTSAKEEALHFAGRDLILDYAKSHTPSSASNAEPSNRLYFAKFADGENALRQVMESHGNNIVSIYFLKDGNTGEQLPSGFVEFENIEAATKALKDINGAQTPSGENIVLAYARPKRQRDDGDRRGGGGFGGGFRQPRQGGGGYGGGRDGGYGAKREAYTSRSWSGRSRNTGGDRDGGGDRNY